MQCFEITLYVILPFVCFGLPYMWSRLVSALQASLLTKVKFMKFLRHCLQTRWNNDDVINFCVHHNQISWCTWKNFVLQLQELLLLMNDYYCYYYYYHHHHHHHHHYHHHRYHHQHQHKYFLWHNSPNGPGPPHYQGFTITLRHTTLGRNPLDEWSPRRIDLSLTTHNTRNRHMSML